MDNYSNKNTQNLSPENGWTAKRKDLGAPIEQKIIYSAFLTLTVKNIDTTLSSIKAIAKQYKGYVSESGTSRAVIRVDSQFLNDAVADIENLGKVERKTVKGQDVTDKYLDLSIRLDNAEKARDRYLALLAKAENVEAALKVEKELERLNLTIDSLKGQRNKISHLTKYSTITVNLKEKQKLGILGYVGVGVYRSVKWLFVRG